MIKLDLLISWYKDNYSWISWVFSGAGCLILGWVISVFQKRKPSQNLTAGNNCNINQTTGNITQTITIKGKENAK